MKTKEIDVWVNKHVYDDNRTSPSTYFRDEITDDEISEYVRAKLVIEIPEKKIEITESKVRDVLISKVYGGIEDCNLVDTIMEELGFSK